MMTTSEICDSHRQTSAAEAMDTWTSSHARWTRWELESSPGCPSVKRLSVVLGRFAPFLGGELKFRHHPKGRKMMAGESQQLTIFNLQ